MCLECTEGEHREHVTVPLRDVLEQHKSALKNQLETVRNRYDFQCCNPVWIRRLHSEDLGSIGNMNANLKVLFCVYLLCFLLADYPS